MPRADLPTPAPLELATSSRLLRLVLSSLCSNHISMATASFDSISTLRDALPTLHPLAALTKEEVRLTSKVVKQHNAKQHGEQDGISSLRQKIDGLINQV